VASLVATLLTGGWIRAAMAWPPRPVAGGLAAMAFIAIVLVPSFRRRERAARDA
jgi:hypothetical protein